MKKERRSRVSAVIIGVPLIVAIVLAVLMAYVNITKWTGGVRATFPKILIIKDFSPT